MKFNEKLKMKKLNQIYCNKTKVKKRFNFDIFYAS